MIVNEWEISYGRSYELDKNAPGTATVTIIDTTGEVDPTSGAYAFDPGTPAAIALTNPVTQTEHTVFRGYVASLTYDMYQTQEYAVATLELVDGLDRLARTEMYAGVGQVLEWGDVAILSSVQDGDVIFYEDDQVAHRINQVLDQAGWPTGLREVYSGNVPLSEVVYAYRTPCLDAILDAADAEFPGLGNFWIQHKNANAGKATFHGRLARFNPADVQYHITTWDCGDLTAVTGDPTKAVIFELAYSVDVNRIINSAIATPKDIANADIEGQRYEDATSISTYGSRSESFDNLLTAGDYFDGATANAATRKFAQYYVTNYKDPRTRVDRVSFKGLPEDDAKAGPVWALMCGVDISDIISLTTTHQAGGGFSEDFYVEGVRLRKGPHPYDVTCELDLSPRAYFNTNPWS